MIAQHGDIGEMCQPVAETTPIQELTALVKRVQSGEIAALPQLRSVLDANPNIWRVIGDLASHAEETLLRLIAGNDVLGHEAIRRKLADLKSRLADDTPTQLEALLIERIGLCWLATHFAEIDAADARLKDQGLSSASLLSQKRLDSAHRRYAHAIRALATIRHLLKPRQKAKPQAQRRRQELRSLCGASVSNTALLIE